MLWVKYLFHSNETKNEISKKPSFPSLPLLSPPPPPNMCISLQIEAL